MRPWQVYWWYASSHKCVKIGYGFDPEDRLRRYSEKYGLDADISSLRTRVMRSKTAAIYVEKLLHERLEAEYVGVDGILRIEWEAKIGFGDSQELFDIGSNDYDSVDWLVGQLFDEIVGAMPSDAELAAMWRARIVSVLEAAEDGGTDTPF